MSVFGRVTCQLFNDTFLKESYMKKYFWVWAQIMFIFTSFLSKNHYIVQGQHIWWSLGCLQTCKDHFLRMPHWRYFKHTPVFSHYVICIQTCSQNKFWTITVCNLKQVLTRYAFLFPITPVSVPELLWKSHSGRRKKIMNHFYYLNLLQRRLISCSRSYHLSFPFLCTLPCLLPCCLIILCSPSIIIILWSSICGPCVQRYKNCCRYISRTYYMLIILILGWMGRTFITTKLCSIIKKFFIKCFLYIFLTSVFYR